MPEMSYEEISGLKMQSHSDQNYDIKGIIIM
jgi:hypothetical protein